MCGGSDPIQAVSDALASADPGPAIGSGLSSLDSAVSQNVPGGWGTIGALAAAIVTAGASIPASEAEFIAADAANLASQGLSQEAIAQNLAASYSISASDAAAAAAATNTGAAETFAQTGTLNPEFTTQQTADPFAGLSSNAPVDTTLSQSAANTTPGLDFVGPTGTPDIPAADAAAQANQSSNILGNTTDASGNVTSTFDDGSTMTVDSSGNVINTTEAPADPLNLKDLLDNPISKRIGSTLANKALNSKLAPATHAIAGKTGFKPVGQGGLSMTNLPGGDNSTGSESTGMELTPGLSMGNPNYTLGNTPFTTDLYNVPTNPVLTAPQKFAMGGYAEGGEYQEHNPSFYSEGGMENRYVQGDGDGTSDDVAAMLANGEFVIPADVVAALGNGSNDAGAHVLDQFLSVVREDNHSNDPDELPPESKGPLAYLAQARKRA